MNRLRLFSNEISPSCSYCKYGNLSRNGDTILCEKYGVSSPSDFCKKFYYAPLKRIPNRKPRLQTYTPEEFKL